MILGLSYPTVAWLMQAGVAVAFAVAAIGKFSAPADFARALRLSNGRVPPWVAPLVPYGELGLAFALAQPWRPLRDLACLGALVALGGFTAFLYGNPQLDAEGGCHCFGAFEASRRVSIARNLGFVLLAFGGLGLGPLGPWYATAALLLGTPTGFAATYVLFLGRTPREPLPLQGDPDLGGRQTMLVFLSAGCTNCEAVRARLPHWWADEEGPRVVVHEDPEALDRYGVARTPSALVLDADGHQVDGNGRPSAERVVGPEAVLRRWQVARQGHDLPLPAGAERTLLVFLRRDDPAPRVSVPPGAAVVVLAPERLRADVGRPVTLDPDGRYAAHFGVTTTPATVLVDARGRVVADAT
ncbi:MauE/DoxX family redox-associated membrane protein [Spongisporangium articulatum]|uniref:MauE/DoxX family redox-associated membrane protein n=1 Tax=Spongisporangium articulatum TaxID=3362603 RepID=A0ABW8AID0_9ACTN